MDTKKDDKDHRQTSAELLDLENSPGSSILLLRKPADSSTAKYPGPGATFKMPQSSVLQRARAFLPQMASANNKLSDVQPEEIDIEHVDSSASHIIEMNLAMVPTEDSSDCESDIKCHLTSPVSVKPQDVDISTTDSDNDDSDTDEPVFGPVTEKTLKLTTSTKYHKAKIEELGSEGTVLSEKLQT